MEKLNDEINEFENELIKLNDIKKKLEKLKKNIEEKIKKGRENIKELKNSLLKDDSNIYELIEKVKLERNQLSSKQFKMPREIKSPNCPPCSIENLMNVIFISNDENIHYSVICKNTDIFSQIEEIFYDKYPDYKNEKNYFVANGNKVDRSKNLDDNNIKNSDIILFYD